MPEHRSTPRQFDVLLRIFKISQSDKETVLGDKLQRLMRVGFVSILVAVFAQTIGMLNSSVRAQSITTKNPISIQPDAVSQADATVLLPPRQQPSHSLVVPSALPSHYDSESSQTYDDPSTLSPHPDIAPPSDVMTRITPIRYKKVICLSRNEAPGQTKITSKGEDGLLETTYKVVTSRHDIKHYVYVSERVIKQPVNMEVRAGYSSRSTIVMPSRSGVYNRTAELDLIATGYSPGEGPGHGYCKTGMRAGYGVVAVDPRIIPLHSKLYISGYGYAVAGDTGGAIKGHRIDLGQNTRSEALSVGRRHVHVYLLSN